VFHVRSWNKTLECNLKETESSESENAKSWVKTMLTAFFDAKGIIL
jgi:hypothetical protein